MAKKAGKYRYDYKQYYVTDNEGCSLPENIPLKADNRYQSKKNEALLAKKKLKNHILKKAKKNKSLTN